MRGRRCRRLRARRTRGPNRLIPLTEANTAAGNASRKSGPHPGSIRPSVPKMLYVRRSATGSLMRSERRSPKTSRAIFARAKRPIAALSQRISCEKFSVNAAFDAAHAANSCAMALDEFAKSCAYRCPTKRRRIRRRSLRIEPVLRLRSHIVAKAAAALPFNRPCDWSCMSATEQGPSYLTKPDYLGTSRTAGRT